MKKYLFSLLVVMLIIPSVTFASWWNPFSWGWFKQQPQTDNTVLFTTSNGNPITIPSSVTVPLTIPETTPVSVNSNKKITTNDTQKKSTPKAIIAPVVPLVVVTPTPSAFDACKNIEGTQTLVPSGMYVDNGNCFTIVVKTDQQKCEDSFGSNSLYNGQKNTNGGLICGCKNGYDWNSNQTYCVAVQVKTGYQVCSEMNATWDGTMVSGKYNCTCPTGYVSNSAGTSCQASNQNSSQYQQQLTSLQNQASQIQTEMNNCLSNMSSPVAEGNGAISAQSQATQCSSYSYQLQLIYNAENTLQGKAIVPITITPVIIPSYTKPKPAICNTGIDVGGLDLGGVIGGGQGSVSCN